MTKAEDDKPDITLIMEKVDPAGPASIENMAMYACRGSGKGCERNRHRKKRTHCDDCLGPLSNDLTLEDVRAMIERGDA